MTVFFIRLSFKGTVENQALPSLHAGSYINTFVFPLFVSYCRTPLNKCGHFTKLPTKDEIDDLKLWVSALNAVFMWHFLRFCKKMFTNKDLIDSVLSS